MSRAAERLRCLGERTARLVGLAALLALAFAPGRLYILLVLALLALIVGLRDRGQGRGGLVWPLLLVLAAAVAVQLLARRDADRLEQFYAEHTPIDLSEVVDSVYLGSAQALNGPIEVRVTVADGKIAMLDLLRNQELAYAFDDALAAAPTLTTTDLSSTTDLLLRNERDVAALQRAVEDALLKGRADRPRLNPLSRAAFFVSSNRADRITFNALAILFIVLLLFDFVLQPALAPGTGQSLTCYNCQACVGVCPIKMVGSDPFPMIMVLEARAGNYARVAELAKYCVACGKCAAKCPVGNSGPSLAAAGVLLDRRNRRAKAQRAAAQTHEADNV